MVGGSLVGIEEKVESIKGEDVIWREGIVMRK